MTKALIIGGGIGGLTTALTLHRMGIEATVCESVANIQALGVGINVLPHAVRILDALGLREALERTAIRTSTLRFHARQGQTIWTEPEQARRAHGNIGGLVGRVRILVQSGEGIF